MYFAFKKNQDHQIVKLFNSIIKPGDTIVDVGANIGFYSLMFSKLVGIQGKVYSFEPDTYNFKRLHQATKSHKNILIKNAAVGGHSGSLEFYTSANKNVDHRAYAPDTYASKYQVDCLCLDDFILHANFLKLDVQGFEMAVYRGAKKLLESNPNIQIISEFWPYGLQKAGSSKEDFFDFFERIGFTILLLHKGHQTVIERNMLIEFKVHEDTYYNVLICKKRDEN